MAAEAEQDELINEKNYDYNPDVYKYGDLYGVRIRSSIGNWRDMWSWRDWVKEPYWFKLKLYLQTKPCGYKFYRVSVNGVSRVMSRVLFKLYNKNWDITDNSNMNQIDHINQNSLDNRIENLRVFTNQQNSFNKTCRGTRQRPSGKWQARITYNGKTKTKQPFDTEPEAHEYYLLLKTEYHILPE